MEDKKRVAVLFIHGILGTPRHFDCFLRFIPPTWSTHNILLKGHGGSVKDFSKASMNEWKKQVSQTLDKLLKENDRVIIVAHSMGTLFAIREATEKPIDELFLMNVPLKIHITVRLIKNVLEVYSGNINPDDKWSVAVKKAYGIGSDRNILSYIGWVPRFLELFSEIRKTRKLIGKLSVPSHVYLSLHDEVVSAKCRNLLKCNPCITTKMLNKSGHLYYSPTDQRILNKEFEKMIQRITNT